VARAVATQARESRSGSYAGFRVLVNMTQFSGDPLGVREHHAETVIRRIEAQEQRHRVAERAAATAPAYGVQLRETATLSERAVTSAKATGKMLVQFISPGWGSSGYYSPDVLHEAAANRVIPAGTHMYADHPTAEDRNSRPERSIRDLMAVTTSDAQIAPNGALVGEVRVMAPYADLIADLKDHIGVSILGDATDIYEGEAEGRRGRIIAGLNKVHSVDFVTRAGRGGQILSVLEELR
jgi:hypothetical protein